MALNSIYAGLLPEMCLSREKSDACRRYFLDHHYPVLQGKMPDGETERQFLLFKQKDLVEFLTGKILFSGSAYFRMYFAVDENKLDLVFAIQDTENVIADTNTHAEKYFIWNGDEFKEIERGTIENAGSAANRVNIYKQTKKKFLEEKINANPTRCMTVPMDYIREFIIEISVHAPKNIRAHFSSYLKESDYAPENMFVDFDLLDDDGNIMYLEDCKNDMYNTRQIATKKFYERHAHDRLGRRQEEHKGRSIFNNSTLCPPSTDCIAEPTLP